MFELLFSCVLTALFTVGILVFYLRRTMPDIQEILDDVGASISESMTGMSKTVTESFKNPAVKNFMSQMGSKSGEARASKALKNRVAEKALGQNILLKKALEYLDITPMEGIELMGDPTVGPVIRNLMAGFSKGGQGLLQGFNNPGGRSPHSRGNVPLMS